MFNCEICSKEKEIFAWPLAEENKFIHICYDCLDNAHFCTHMVWPYDSGINYEDYKDYDVKYIKKKEK